MIEINYFGHTFDVPEETIAVATNPNGAIYAYESIPKLGHAVWYTCRRYTLKSKSNMGKIPTHN